MELKDERIIEYLLDNGPSSPSIMAFSKGISGCKEEIQGRCRDLDQESLIVRVQEDTYRITEVGRSYLDGSFDPNDGIVVEYKGPDVPRVLKEDIGARGKAMYRGPNQNYLCIPRKRWLECLSEGV